MATPGALRAAQIIVGGPPNKLIETRYGQKSAEGVADLIDREMDMPKLLALNKQLLEACRIQLRDYPPAGDYIPPNERRGVIKTAIALARAAAELDDNREEENI